MKLIQFLQKVPGSASLNDLRPIGLIEITRKVWSIIILRKITNVLRKYKILADSQYGFRQGHGVDSHIIQLLSILEDAKEKEFNIDLASWDQKKAFDSIGKNLQYIGWRRVGVSPEIARWLASLDLNGVYVVKSKYACHELSSRVHCINDMLSICAKLGLTASRGATQGDVISPTAWNVTFDPLIRMLERFYSKHPLHLTGPDSTVYRLGPLAYADDLVTITGNRRHTQQISNIICLWITMVGLQLSPGTSTEPKLRLLTSFPNTGHIRVHDWSWTSLDLPFSGPDGIVKILGVPITLSLDWTPAVKRMESIVLKAHSSLIKKRALLSTKGALLVTCTMSAVLYVLQFSGASSAQVARLDKALLSLYRAHYCIGYYTASAVLYNKNLGGGLPSLINQLRIRKENLRYRLRQEGGRAAMAVEALVLRQGRWTEHCNGLTVSQHDLSASGRTFQIPGNKGTEGTWASDLFTQLGHGQLTSTWHGYHSFGSENYDLLNLHSGKKLVRALDLQRIEDMIDWSCTPPTPLRWFRGNLRELGTDVFRDFSHALSTRINHPVGTGPICRLQRGHCILITLDDRHRATLKTVHQHCLFILQGYSVDSETWYGTCWVPVNTITVASRFRQMDHQASIGVTGNRSFSPADLAAGTLAIVSDHRVLNYPSGLTLLSLNHSLQLVTQMRGSLNSPVPHPLIQNLLKWMEQYHINPVIAGSDGSFQILKRPLSGIFSPPSPSDLQAGGAIVFGNSAFNPSRRHTNNLSDRVGPAGVIRIINGHLVRDSSANLMEMLATVLVQQIRFHYKLNHNRDFEIFSDCMSNIQVVRNATPDAHRSLATKYQSALYHNLVQYGGASTVSWVAAHADHDRYNNRGIKVRKTKSLAEFTKPEWLNYLADKFSAFTYSHEQLLLTEQLLPCPITLVEARDILNSLSSSGSVTWMINGETVKGIVARENTLVLEHDYLMHREKISVGRIPWSEMSTGLLLPMLTLSKEWNTPGKRLKLLRMIWDYLPHGRNKVKHLSATSSSLDPQIYWNSLPRCPLGCAAPDDRHHILMECTHAAILQVRTEGFDELERNIAHILDPRISKFWGLILGTMRRKDPLRLTSSILVGCPHISHLQEWNRHMSQLLYGHTVIMQATIESIPLFNALFRLSRRLWYTYCRETHPLQLKLKMLRHNVQQTLQLSSSPRSAGASPSQGSWQVELPGGTYLPELTSTPVYASDQENLTAGSPLGVSGTGLSDGGTPTQEVSGATGDPSPNSTSLKWEGWSFPK